MGLPVVGLESPGRSSFQSFTVKDLQRDADGLVIPDDPNQPLTVVEVQFQKDETIYARIVSEMVSAQTAHEMRPVQGIIFFRYNRLDPKTPPWNRVIQAVVLQDALAAFEAKHPLHPLVAVFKPVVVTDPERLEREAVRYFTAIKRGDIAADCKATLLDVFVNWVGQRLKHKGRKEIQAMFLDELPDIEDTQLGKDLIEIGEQHGERRGEQRGLEKAIEVFLTSKHGRITKTLQTKIQSLTAQQAERLLAHLPHCNTLDDVKNWLKKAC